MLTPNQDMVTAMAVYNGDGNNNSYIGANGDDTISGNGGNDSVYGGSGADAVNGERSNDWPLVH